MSEIELISSVLGWSVAIFALVVASIAHNINKHKDYRPMFSSLEAESLTDPVRIMPRPTIEMEVGQMIIYSMQNEPYLWKIIGDSRIQKDNICVWVYNTACNVSLYVDNKTQDIFTEYHKEAIFEEYKTIKYSRMMGTADLRYILSEKA